MSKKFFPLYNNNLVNVSSFYYRVLVLKIPVYISIRVVNRFAGFAWRVQIFWCPSSNDYMTEMSKSSMSFLGGFDSRESINAIQYRRKYIGLVKAEITIDF